MGNTFKFCLITLLVEFFAAGKVQADVRANFETGNLTQTSADDSTAAGNFQILLARQYQSRTLHNEKFGFGWCSPIELHQSIAKNGKKKIEECQTSIDPGWIRHFEGHGRLIFLKVNSGLSYQFIYDQQGNLQKVRNSLGETLSIKIDSRTDHIVRIKSRNALDLEYIYEHDNLVQVLNRGRPLWSYTYDSLHNLTSAQFNLIPEFSAQYDLQNDRVLNLNSKHRPSLSVRTAQLP